MRDILLFGCSGRGGMSIEFSCLRKFYKIAHGDVDKDSVGSSRFSPLLQFAAE